MRIDTSGSSRSLCPRIDAMWTLSAAKIRDLEKNYDTAKGSPVFTACGKYTSRGWTEWTQGFQYGSALLQFDAAGEEEFLLSGRRNTVERMAAHLTHTGVHDHGFNNVSTYGNLLRMAGEGRYRAEPWERRFYALALRCSGAVQASRWTELPDGGFIRSFNGPHSLFADTVRSLRSLAVAHRLGHVLLGENDRRIPLLDRLMKHARATARYAVYYGEGRDAYDVSGRVAHESVFNVTDGKYRCPNSQQGFSPFSTWTRGLAWIILGFAEELEFLSSLDPAELAPYGGAEAVKKELRKTLDATCGFWVDNTPLDGIPYWDTGAPGLERLGDWRARVSEPYNDHEPIDSSAAAIACQGLLRYGHWLQAGPDPAAGKRWEAAGLTVLNALLAEPYLSTSRDHQGLLLHSVYHRPNGWDLVPDGRKVPCGESSMWGDYHLREAALYVQRLARGEPYFTFFNVKEEA